MYTYIFKLNISIIYSAEYIIILFSFFNIILYIYIDIHLGYNVPNTLSIRL